MIYKQYAAGMWWWYYKDQDGRYWTLMEIDDVWTRWPANWDDPEKIQQSSRLEFLLLTNLAFESIPWEREENQKQ